MTDVAGQLACFARYAGVIEELLRRETGETAGALDQAAAALHLALGLGWQGGEPATGTSVLPAPDFVAQASRLWCRCSDASALSGGLGTPGVIAAGKKPDAAGHTRPVYRPLVLHAWVTALDLMRDTPDDPAVISLHAACESAAAELANGDPAGELSAAHGGVVAERAWWALALFEAGRLFGRLIWVERAMDVLMPLVAGQQKSGALLSTTASDNPETHWYHELVILHALAGYAVRAEDRLAARAVRLATEFHLGETQPDHATTQPWGLFAFLWNPATQILADGMLHAVRTQHPAGPDPVTRILLADTLVCLRAYCS
ncbi:MAG: hypothetical protein ACHRHE_19310 [Tepidisphaerales bacterium]